MTQYQPLTPDEIKEIAGKYFERRVLKTTAQAEPSLVLIGGQPGAGKSSAGIMVRRELAEQGGFIHLDADRMRASIDTKGTKPTSEETQKDAGLLVSELRKSAVEAKRNALEEGTFWNTAAVSAFVDARKQDGFKVEMVAVATPREESLLGIHQRFELQHIRADGNPRFVSEEYHDKTMREFENTLARNEPKFDRVRVINRAGNVLFDSHARERGGASAIQALQDGRRLTDSRLAEIGKAWLAVKAQAEGRGADAAYLAQIQRHTERIDTLQKDRIHGHAMQSLDDNLKTLTSDRRFGSHTDEELLKVAYFRGVHEKSNAFKGEGVDFGNFDSLMADRATVQSKLPEVEDLAHHHVERTKSQTKDDGLSL